MNATELSTNVGKAASVVAPFRQMPKPIYLEGVIKDARQTYGRVDYLIEFNGGAAWVSAESVTIKQR